jgi:hypothetical protein
MAINDTCCIAAGNPSVMGKQDCCSGKIQAGVCQ